MILIDTSAWVEFLRDTGSEVCERVERCLDVEIASCHPVRMEVLAGARDEHHLRQLRGLLSRGVLLPTTPEHYESAATLYRICRRNGHTVRKLTDWVIAAHAITADMALLHADADFDVLAAHTPLQRA